MVSGKYSINSNPTETIPFPIFLDAVLPTILRKVQRKIIRNRDHVVTLRKTPQFSLQLLIALISMEESNLGMNSAEGFTERPTPKATTHPVWRIRDAANQAMISESHMSIRSQSVMPSFSDVLAFFEHIKKNTNFTYFFSLLTEKSTFYRHFLSPIFVVNDQNGHSGERGAQPLQIVWETTLFRSQIAEIIRQECWTGINSFKKPSITIPQRFFLRLKNNY